MVKTFDMKSSLISLAFDIQSKACSGENPDSILLWVRTKTYSLKHQQNQFNKFNSREYRGKKNE